MAEPPEIDPGRVIADLRELDRRTADERGAQRVCWTEPWREARRLLAGLLSELGIEPEVDEAGNLWARLEGANPRAPALVLGSHLDSVPDGGWLDGALGVMAALGVLRAYAEGGRAPAQPLVIVDWADEEGARFGNSLFGSSAFAGTLDPQALGELRDVDGRPIATVLGEHGVVLALAPRCGERRTDLASYLELHIEQGPRMEAAGVRVAAVSGCVGVERCRFAFRGQAAQAGTTPIEARRDAGLAAATAALAIERLAVDEAGFATTGELRIEPGIATVVPGRATLSADLRHPEAAALARMLARTRKATRAAADARGCELTETAIWRIEPIGFDPDLVATARATCAALAGEPAELVSGALHDAAAVARVLPAAMLFAPSLAGISHAVEEDTEEADLALAIEALAELAARALSRKG